MVRPITICNTVNPLYNPQGLFYSGAYLVQACLRWAPNFPNVQEYCLCLDCTVKNAVLNNYSLSFTCTCIVLVVKKKGRGVGERGRKEKGA